MLSFGSNSRRFFRVFIGDEKFRFHEPFRSESNYKSYLHSEIELLTFERDSGQNCYALNYHLNKRTNKSAALNEAWSDYETSVPSKPIDIYCNFDLLVMRIAAHKTCVTYSFNQFEKMNYY